jgi:putative ABC transport system ATP-binding protein
VIEGKEITTSQALRRALKEAPALRRGLLGTVGFAVVGTAIQVVVPIVVQQIMDHEILDPAGVDVTGAVAKGAVALVAMVVAMFVRRIALIRLATAAASGLAELRVKTFSHIHTLSVLHVESERRGALVARVTSDVTTIQDFMNWGGVGLLIGAAQLLLAVVVMFFYGWTLALLVLGGVVTYAAMLVWFQRILQRAHDVVRRRVADSLAALSEAITGLPVIRAYGAENETVRKVEEVLDAQFRSEYRTGKLGAMLFSSAELFAGLITAAVIGVGVVTGAAGGVSAGTLLAFLFLVNLLVDPVQTLVETLDSAQSAAAGVRRILTVLDGDIDVADPGDEGLDLPPGPLGLALRGVRFRYPTGGDVLREIDVAIQSGRSVAVVGETGSGKSTFAKLVTRLLDPSDGVVEIGGIDVARVRFDSLRSRVAFVPQEGFLFDSTVAENVRYGDIDASDDEIRQAFRELELDDWIETLPAGIHTPVGERGGRLSAGERQLVALTRAWMVDPDLLVLDEATSAVDPALEVRLRRAMEHLTEGRTSITVAHRLSTAEASDEILVFDEGRLVERGTHVELLSLGGVYAALHTDWAAGVAG